MRSFVLILSFAVVACGPQSSDPELDELYAEAQALNRPPANAQFSDLWGRSGNAWKPTSRLPDFSWAGYAGGERRIPRWPKGIDVRDFGAKANDGDDDSAAFTRALAAADRDTAVFVPAGRWHLRKIVELNRNRVVLRGEGSGPQGTVLVVDRSLKAVYGVPPGKDPEFWASHGGFLHIGGKGSEDKLADLIGGGKRGEHWIEVDDASKLEAGEIVTLYLDMNGDVERELYDGQFQLNGGCLDDLELPVQIDRIDGRRVRLLQPLRLDLPRSASPRLKKAPAVSHVGVEDLRFEFQSGPYEGHHREDGFNGIEVERAHNLWVRNVTFHDADLGIILERTKFATVEDVKFTADRQGREGVQAHHGLTLSNAADSLVQQVAFELDLWHELTLVRAAHGNVFRRVSGREVNLDHHGEAPFENLFTNFGAVDRWSWLSGGGAACKGPHSGARGTFWNMKNLSLPRRYDDTDGDTDGETENLPWVSIQTTLIGDVPEATAKNQTGRWVEDLPRLWPEDLYRAQYVARRTAR